MLLSLLMDRFVNVADAVDRIDGRAEREQRRLRRCRVPPMAAVIVIVGGAT